MGKPAATLGDVAAHGGSIAVGSPTVFIGGRPAARLGDSVACGVHGTGVIAIGSTSVFINGKPAARMGDPTACLVPGLAAANVPPVLGAPPIEWAGSFDPKKNGKFHEQNDKEVGGTSALHAEAHVTDTDKDGTRDNISVAAELLRMRNDGALSPPSVDIPLLGRMEVYGTHSEDIVYGSAQASANVTHFGGSASGTVEGGLSKSSGSISISPVGDKGKNPLISLGQEVNLMHAKGEADVLVGSDSNRVGLGGGYSYGAEAVSTETTLIGTTPSIKDYNAQAIFKKSFAWGHTPEIGGGGWLYYDKSKQRLFFRIKGAIAAFLKIGGELEVSMGMKFHDDPPAEPVPSAPPAPKVPGLTAGGVAGLIATGNPTVLIG